MITRVLIVRLGAFGDIVHALPVAAALRSAWSDAQIDWVVDRRYRGVLELARGLDRVIEVGANSWPLAVLPLRRRRYDVAIDLQGLLKSAALARWTGARRVIGFHPDHLRERAARLFHTETVTPPSDGHVIAKNMSVLPALGVPTGPPRFPIEIPPSSIASDVRGALGVGARDPFAVLNPSAGWPNKQWPPARFGEIAAHLKERHGLPSIVIWGPNERALAERVVAASRDCACLAPRTTLGDLAALISAGALVISGDTGPLHLATALGTPSVGLFGPTSPVRNGAFVPEDVSVSRFEACECHHKRRCSRPTACIIDISIAEVIAAVDHRLMSVPVHE